MIVDGSHHRPRCCVLAAMAASQTTLQLDCGGTAQRGAGADPSFSALSAIAARIGANGPYLCCCSLKPSA
jgi:hypothetical protein